MVAFKKERVLETAVDLFFEHGYEKTTLEAVADALEVTKPFIYSYYPSKANLLADICQRATHISVEAIQRILDQPGNAIEHMKELGVALIDTVIENQKYLAIFLREEKNLEVADARRVYAMRHEYDRLFKALLQKGLDERLFAIKDRDATALAISGMINWICVWYRPDGRMGPKALATTFTELMLNMVGANSPTKSKPQPPLFVGRPVKK